ncbi:hamartin [Elysia marginata]|uniref:Hamartin n=1 Tax=Elysia marginata TaxID=1093978 RepID=A0AAV4IFQ9_9GAST|nr:hamartin [Elysia marginata]
MAAGSSGHLPVEHIFQLLDSAETVSGIREIILENLSSTKETWLIHLLVDHYFQTQSPNVQEIFAELKESQVKALLDKIQDGLKSPETRQPALQLVLFLAYREIHWCHQIVDTPLLSSIFKILKTETDVPLLMTSLMIIVILLPSLPVNLGKELPTIFEIFGRMTILCAKSPATTPEVFVLYLHVAIYSLFHRLYGMYPCSFMSYIRKFYTQKENIRIYEEIVLPMIERVRLHPKLIMGQKEAETTKNTWKNQETQDIVVACSRLSLDYVEGSLEDTHCPVFHSLQAVDKFRQLSVEKQRHQQALTIRVPSKAVVIPHRQGVSDESSTVSTISSSLPVPDLDITTVGESPSILLGLSTPPGSQRATPGPALLEPGHATVSDGGTGGDMSGQLTPSQADDGDKTPLSRSSSRGGFQASKSTSDPKRPAPRPAITPLTPGSTSHAALPWMSPAVGAGAGPAGGESSPFKSKSSAFEYPKTSAMRILSFTSSLGDTEEEQGEKAVPAISLQASTEETETVSSARSSETSESAKLEKQGAAAASEGLESSLGSSSKKQSDVTHRSLSQQGQKKPPGATVKTIDVLTQVADKLSASDNTVNVDQEVEEINEREDKFDESAALTTSTSTITSQTDITAESVRQFMKKVNRLRFNSLTSNSSSNEDTDITAHSLPGIVHHRRPRSCPPFKRSSPPIGQEASTTSRRPQHRHSHLIQASGRTGRTLTAADRSVSLHQRGGKGAFTSQRSVPGDGSCPSEVPQSEDSSDDVTSSASSKDTPRKLCLAEQQNRKQSQAGQPVTDILRALPENVNAVFQCILAPSKLAVCNKCHQELVVTSVQSSYGETAQTLSGKEISLFSTVAPPELLDRHLRLGSDLHAKELTKIPLTSKESTNWTHFGGLPPADEVSILRGQILLMQTQIMYERHKRCNHAKRNRRLLRRMTHIASLEEQQKSLMSKIQLHEEEIQQLSVSVRLLQEDNRMLRQSKESDEYEKLVEFRTSLKENKDLKAASVVLKNLLLTQREEYDKQQKKLDSVQHINLENEKELRICRDRLALTDKLKQQVLQLQNEVLLTQEFHQKCQEKLHQSNGMTKQKAEESYLISALGAEIKVLKEESKRSLNLFDAAQARTQELEELLKAKDKIITELKESFDAAKSCYHAQLQALEERCTSLIHTNQSLEGQVMDLTGQLDQANHRKMAEARRAIGQSTTTMTSSAQVDRLDSDSSSTSSAAGSKTVSKDTTGSGTVSNTDRSDEKGGRGSGEGGQRGEEGKGDGGKGTGDSSGKKDKDSQLPVGSVQSQAETLPDSGFPSRSSYRQDSPSDASVVSGLGQSVNTADSGHWPK